MSILVVDDCQSISLLLSSMIETLGYHPVSFSSGEEAIDYISAQGDAGLPDLVILDVKMQGIDGYETATQIKRHTIGHHIPIIFISGLKDENILSKCLAIGDDFIAKPFSTEIVLSKIKAHLRVGSVYTQLREQNKVLNRYKQITDNEHHVVEAIFANQFERHIIQVPNLLYYISPKSVFNGDVILTAVGPDGSLYVAVGDVTGHGLPAAVGAIPVYPMFRTMAGKGLGVGTIAAEMNRGLEETLPDNMMLAMSLLKLSASADTITVWSGGMPSMLLEDGKGNIKSLIPARHCPLGMLKTNEFCMDVDVYPVSRDDRVYMFTDGLEESRNPSQKMFSEERLHSLFDGSEQRMFAHILAEHEAFIEGQEQDDDITLLQLICTPQGEELNDSAPEQRSITLPLPWSARIELSVADMQRADPAFQALKLLDAVVNIDGHRDYFATLLTESYTNALEHGLLGLDSAMRSTDDGCIEYQRLRRERLEALSEGEIVINLSFQPAKDESLVTIIVSDSGEGFDAEQFQQPVEGSGIGKGIATMKLLCRSVEFLEGGSTVKLTYKLKNR